MNDIHITKTFYDWCIEKNHIDYLQLWDDKNNLSPKEISFSSKKKVLIKCNRGMHAAERNNTTADIEFRLQKERDLYKKNYAIDNGYYYLEIPYLSEEDDAYKQIILSKIHQINKNL